MTTKILGALALLSLLSSCAFEGTVVQKEARPLPLAYSLGTDVICKFQLRDRSGALCWQMVSPEVYNTYEVGDYFNDLNPVPPHHGFGKDGKDMSAPWTPQFEVIPANTPKFEPIPLRDDFRGRPETESQPQSAPAPAATTMRTHRVAKTTHRHRSHIAKSSKTTHKRHLAKRVRHHTVVAKN
ncbi:MAG: hypothetical protein M3R59_07475 [Verrucomicrobiota bacterium]|nr:hypothetical protein [Verrucomicrobiota bacterium]